MKICTKCGERKCNDEFYHNYSRKDYRERACKKCMRAQREKRAIHNGEQYRLRQLERTRDDFINKKNTIEAVIREVIVEPHVRSINEKIKKLDQRIESGEWKLR